MSTLTATRFAQRTRTVNTAGLRPTVTDAPGEWLRVVAVRQGAAGGGQAPRERADRLLVRWADTPLEFVPVLRAGERLDVDGHGLVELLEDPRALRSGGRLVARQAAAMLVTDLYPLTVDVVDQGGVVVRGAVPCAVWQPQESEQPRGNFTDYEAEAPVEHADVLTVNRALRLSDGTVLKVTSHMMDVAGAAPPRVRLGVRGDG